MSAPPVATAINLNDTDPAAPTNEQNIVFSSSAPYTETVEVNNEPQTVQVRDCSAVDPVMVGDTGSGGKSGNVPAPPAGSAAAGEFLSASGTWAVPGPSFPIDVADGGTGDVSLTAHAVLVGEGTSPVATVGPGTTNYPLLGQGSSADPAFKQPRGNTSVVQLADSTTNPTSGDLASFDANGNVKDSGVAASAVLTSQQLVIGFVLLSGVTGTNVGPELAAPRAGTISKCKIITKSSDGSTALTIKVKKNGTDIFSTDPTVAAGTAAGTLSTFTSLTSSPLSVAADDVFTIDVTSGTSNWQATVQLEG